MSAHVQQVVKDVLTQQQFLDQFIGGQKAQLSWYVQLIAEQLSWGDAEHVSALAVQPRLPSVTCH